MRTRRFIQFLTVALVLLAMQGCGTLRPAVRADVSIPGKEIGYAFKGVREGPTSYKVGNATYSPKAGFRFYTAFVTLSNQTGDRTVVDLQNFVLFDHKKKFYFPELVYLNELEGLESPFLDKAIDTNKSLSAGLIYILSVDSKADRLMFPDQEEVQLPEATRKE